MTDTHTHRSPRLRSLRILADILIRAAVLVGVVAVAPALSGEDDALAVGLTVFFVLAATAFAGGLLDGMFQRDRRRLAVVWAVVVPLVAVLETAYSLWTTVTEPGAFPSRQDALAYASGDVVSSLLVFSCLVGPPAVLGIGLGLLIRPSLRQAAGGGRPSRAQRSRPATDGGDRR